MSSISFECPECKNQISADRSLCGNIMICKGCSKAIVIPLPGIHEGMQLGDFQIQKRLGTGGMGEVWLAYHPAMDRHVAVKILSPKFTSNKTFLDRFMNEVKNSAKLAHPNIVTAHHAGYQDGIYFMAISYVQGDSLHERLDRGLVIPEKEALNIAYCIADALEYAWDEYRIVHRDIKPANILIDKKGVPKLLDLGISKSIDEDSTLTMTGTFVGTPFYMGPEQALGDKNIDFRADIYSLGATLYHMVTGTVPFDGETAMAIISMHLHHPLPSVKERNRNVSDQCAALIQVLMAKRMEDRPQSWAEVKESIKLVQNGEFPKLKPVTQPPPDLYATQVAPDPRSGAPTAIAPAPGPQTADAAASVTREAPAGTTAGRKDEENPIQPVEDKMESPGGMKPIIILCGLLAIVAFIVLLAFAGYLVFKNITKRGAPGKTAPVEKIEKGYAEDAAVVEEPQSESGESKIQKDQDKEASSKDIEKKPEDSVETAETPEASETAETAKPAEIKESEAPKAATPLPEDKPKQLEKKDPEKKKDSERYKPSW